MQIRSITAYANTYKNNIYNNENQTQINFQGNIAQSTNNSKIFSFISKPFTRQYDKLTSFLAKGFGKAMNSKTAENLICATQNNKKLHDHLVKYQVSHLLTASSIVLSGLYINKTLKNDKLDPDKKRTLAINQATVWGVSTIMGYTFSRLVEKKTNEIIKKFKEINKELGEQKLNRYANGIKTAKALMVFDIVYRYLTPVLVTPLANHIGNKLHEKDKTTTQAY